MNHLLRGLHTILRTSRLFVMIKTFEIEKFPRDFAVGSRSSLGFFGLPACRFLVKRFFVKV